MTKHEILDIDIVCIDKAGNTVDLTNKVVHIVATERLGTRKVLFKYRSDIDNQISITDIVNGAINLTVLNTTGFTSVDYLIEVAYVDTNDYVVKLDPYFTDSYQKFYYYFT